MSHLVAPSLLAADFTALGEAVDMIDRSKADWLHLDIMDGRFVPNISYGMPVIKAIRPLTKKPFDTHLMIVEPEKYIDDFRKAGADIITVHYETCPHLHRTIQQIHNTGAKAGVSINPHTSIELLSDILPEADLVLVMSVNPGFGGQSFIPNSLQKIRQLKALISQTGSNALIEVDGGVSAGNAADILKAGADVLVAGSSVFKADDPESTIAHLKSIDINTFTA